MPARGEIATKKTQFKSLISYFPEVLVLLAIGVLIFWLPFPIPFSILLGVGFLWISFQDFNTNEIGLIPLIGLAILAVAGLLFFKHSILWSLVSGGALLVFFALVYFLSRGKLGAGDVFVAGIVG